MRKMPIIFSCPWIGAPGSWAFEPGLKHTISFQRVSRLQVASIIMWANSQNISPLIYPIGSTSLENPDYYNSQQIFDKGVKSIQWRKGSSFNKWWTFWHPLAKNKINLDTDLTSFTKINSKWNTGLKCKNINLLEDNRENLCDLGFGNDF